MAPSPPLAGRAPSPGTATRAAIWLLVGVPLTGIVFLVGWMALAFSLADESFAVRRGSVQYYLLIGATIRNAPVIAAKGEPTFHFRGGDGPKMTETEIRYVSRAEPTRLIAELGRYLEARGYKWRKSSTRSPPAGEWGKGSTYFQFRLTRWLAGDGTTEVVVTKFEF